MIIKAFHSVIDIITSEDLAGQRLKVSKGEKPPSSLGPTSVWSFNHEN